MLFSLRIPIFHSFTSLAAIDFCRMYWANSVESWTKCKSLMHLSTFMYTGQNFVHVRTWPKYFDFVLLFSSIMVSFYTMKHEAVDSLADYFIVRYTFFIYWPARTVRDFICIMHYLKTADYCASPSFQIKGHLKWHSSIVA